MSDQKPYSGTSKDRLTALINQDNNTSLVENVDFTYGIPEVFSGNNGRNTRIKLTPLTGEKSEAYVNYWRLSITALDQLPDGYIEVVQIPQLPFTIHSVLDAINTALGLDLTPDEVVNETHTEPKTSYPLKIRTGSFAWLPSTYYFKANMDNYILTEDGKPLETEDDFVFELETA